MAYDVIVVGARVAGAATALLLARQGLRVLAVDRAAFPSDTLSSHQIQPPGVERLARWGCSTGSATRRSPIGCASSRPPRCSTAPSPRAGPSAARAARCSTTRWSRRPGRPAPRCRPAEVERLFGAFAGMTPLDDFFNARTALRLVVTTLAGRRGGRARMTDA